MRASKTPAEPIAIIGTGCRFPGNCDNPSKLWELLRDPRDLLKEIPDTRFNANSFYHPDGGHHGTSNVRHSYLLEEDFTRFDTQFFGIKPVEASAVDPQQRLLLETVYEGLESAGLSIKQLQGSDTAVYVGCMSADFTDMISRDIESFPTYFATGTARSILSNRLSHFFDWHGPSTTIDTACSSSLVALHQAVQTLRSGESSLAVVAGSNLIIGPEQYIAESKLQMLSPTGRSRMWDAAADGYARGEGVAAIILKPLSRAVADGDNIECIVRETGLNQDGKTPGITMPSASAQAALIRLTYAKAGLDLSKPSDRPQYFEAHGTGTPAGDPVEAEAISLAFFGPDLAYTPRTRDESLFVGSIKTVIGHTEGTAGVAGIIKGALALQSGTVPPNRLFERLNPAIKPFYTNLKIPCQAIEWPHLATGGARRVSVNSFGFGGANAHAILESYTPPKASGTASGATFTPFTFSASSETTLQANLASYRDYLLDTPGLNPRDLAWTLNERRSTLPYRVAFPATGIEELINNIDETLKAPEQPSASSGMRKPISDTIRILGIFTGQGAQWPRMGADLLVQSPGASRIVNDLDLSLQQLPHRDRPTWTLRAQLLAASSSSQVDTASISQPLCTAVQIMLVDLLRSAGVELSAVVGHSSGEIGAAYAAGCISAGDAIRIAYYRGLHLKAAVRQGSMMAVGTSFDDAKELCELPSFEGRLCVAASNSSASVTLSGDTDAIEEAKVVLDEEKKFTRLLKVDRAYHSHHMEPCVAPYVKSLRECNVKFRRPTQCRWISSVFTQNIAQIPEEMNESYWGSNLAKPVMFSEALQILLEQDAAFDMAIEVGPHPALKGPASQTIEASIGHAIPYTGVLSRGRNDIASFSAALGFMWSSFGDSVVDFSQFDTFASEAPGRHNLLKGLPTYRWDHNRAFWHESRLSKAFRTRRDQPNELLGRQVLDGTPDQVRWRNVLRPQEIEWLDGHQVQGQMVFPCAGYVSACLEAVLQLCGSRTAQCIELQDFVVSQAITFSDSNSDAEILVTLTEIRNEDHAIHAKFSFYSSTNSESLNMATNATCSAHATLGDVDANLLQAKAEDDFAHLDVESERFYAALEQLGFGYSGPFLALSGTKRKLGAASGFIHNALSNGKSSSQLLIHPATLDAAIQSIMLAYCFPGDSMLRSIYLPTGISRLIVNPMHCLKFAGQQVLVPFDSTASTRTTQGLQGNANIYAPDGSRAIQLESLQTQPLSTPTASNDLNIFTELVWGIDRPDQEEAIKSTELHKLNADLLFSLERVAYYYLKTLNATIPPSERAGLEWHHKRLFAYVDHVMLQASKGANRFARKEWMTDTVDTISQIIERYPENIDLRLMRAVGENLPAVIRGSLTMLQPMMQDNMLNDFYVNAHGMSHYTQYLGSMAKQISHRYPHMNVLEIGAGTGGATKSFLKDLDDGFANYTFTDISSGFFEKASEVFASHRSKMTFQVLDIEKDIESQGFASHSFDVIIASLVLHATKDLAATMRNVRRLLKPGGYLLLLEITENEQMRFGLIFGGLAGWWLGYDDGRVLSPCVGLEEWEAVLKETGFSGIDTAVPHHPELPVPLSVIASQAVDDRVECLRSPLAQPAWPATIPQMTILGGGNEQSTRLAKEVKSMLGTRCGNITFLNSVDDIRPGSLPVGGTVLSLADIHEPILRSMDADRLRAFQEIFKQSGDILWITKGACAGDPYAKMIVGFGRTIVLEMLHLRLQLLDFPPSEKLDAKAIAEAALRLELTGSWEQEEQERPILHSVEPELCFTGGKIFVPRYKLSKEQNARYNCGRRSITQDVNESKVPMEFVNQDGKFHVIESSCVSLSTTVATKLVEIDVLFSMTRAVEVTDGCFLFPLFGTDKRTGGSLLALSATQSSRASVPKHVVIPVSSHRRGDIILQQFYAELLVHSAMRHVPGDSHVVVLDPTIILENALDSIAKRKDYRVTKVTSTPTTTRDNSICIHPMTSQAQILGLMPEDTACFLDMNEESILSCRIRNCLPEYTKIRSESLLTSINSHSATDGSLDVRYLLMEIQYALERKEAHGDSHSKPVNLTELMGITGIKHPYIVDWKASPTASIEVQPIEKHVTLKSDHSYWLVGLTGGLGLSLCEWMSHQGARYIVISSRSPKVDQRWLDKMKSLGVTVMVATNDVSDGTSVRTVYGEICREMPPIAGVVQGAMVLHDTMFSELDIERMSKAITPKVQGSIHLEEIFKDTDLDFFVFFSSMAAVTGNPGQSAYAAANMFMAGLANQRRSRGLNASVVHIGAIFGNGYVTRELTLTQQEFLRKVGNLWLSEQDFHRIFAEAVYAGQRERHRNPELSTGLKMVEGDESKSITWFNNPVFQHCVKQAEEKDAPSSNFGKGMSVKTQLLEAITPDDVYEIILGAFTAKLAVSMQAEGERSLVDLSAESLGIDSLIAVDIRSWFIKELQVEISVLRILGGATIGEMALQAQELLPPELTPKLNPNAKGKTPGLLLTQKQQSLVTNGSNKDGKTQLDITTKKAAPAPNGSGIGPAEINTRLGDQNETGHIDPLAISKKAYETPATTGSSGSDSENSHSNIGPQVTSSQSTGAALSHGSSTSWSEVDESEMDATWESAIIPAKHKAITPNGPTTQVKRKLRMGFSQSGFWFLHKYIQDQSTFNITVSITLNGRLNVRKFEQAVRTLGQRHEALRTRIVDDSSLGAVQEILADAGPRLEQRSILTNDEAEMAYQDLKRYTFKLNEGENMRIILLTRTASSHQLIIGYHHINMDGASLEVLLKDLQMAYNGQQLSQRVLQYADFADQQRREYETGQWDDELSFWKHEFESQPPPLPLLSMAKTLSRAPMTAYSSNFVDFHVDRALQDSIDSICRKLKVTPFHFHLAVFYTVLSRLTDVSDICIGISSANRNREEEMQSVGPYLNLLPLRFRPRLEYTFTNILHMVREKCLAAFSHSRIPFDVLANKLGVPRSASHSPLFQVVVNYRAGISESRLFCDCKSHVTALEQGQSPYDLSLDVIDNPGDACHVMIGGQSTLYDFRAMEIVKNAYFNLLTAFARNSALRLSVPSLYDPSEVKHAMQIARGPSYEYQWPETIPHRIDQMVDKYGGNVALSTGPEQQMTYRELDDQVNSLAAVLSTQDIGREKRVGVFMAPGTNWVCSLLAILRLDATYIAFDPRLGLDRLRLISDECHPELILVDNSTESDVVGLGAHEYTLNIDHVDKNQELHVSTMARPDSVAVIAFTSGSTGTPKGIAMKHHTFRNNIETSTAKWYFREGNEVTLQQSSYSFDMSLSQIFLTLSNGGTLRIVDKLSRGDPKAISSIIASEGITITEATASEYISWLESANMVDIRGSKWRVAVSGGEMVTESLTDALRRLDKSELRLIDCYGPTEITFCSHSRELEYRNDACDRRAGFETWPNYSVYIVDPHMKAMPVGVPGEILIGGAGVVSGYLCPELDARGFVRDTLAPPGFTKNGWTRLHRTGDSGSLDEKGKLILGGRIQGDTQIKLRGMRIDLQEIEHAIISVGDGSIMEAAVTLRQPTVSSADFLVAFVTVAAIAATETKLQGLLQRLPLPQSMVPAMIVPLPKMPKSASNKLDRLALKHIPLPESDNATSEEVRTDKSMSDMKNLWQTVLSEEVITQHQIGPDSDFFHVGGNSMLIVQLQSEIEKKTGTSVAVFDLFNSSTLRHMTSLVYGSSSNPHDIAISLEDETAVATDLPRPSARKRFTAHPEVIGLTGATGFLGQAILNRLLKDCSVQKIHCLAVRRKIEDLPAMFRSPKVVVHPGDLTLPRLGLREEVVREIFPQIDAVIHNGADVSFMKTYESLKPANLEATKELVRLCLPHKLSLHYVSTASVAHFTGLDTFDESTVQDYPPPVEEGYIGTKWASERYLEKVNAIYDLPVWIHRPSSIMRQGTPDNDLMANLLHYSSVLKAVPTVEPWKGWLDFVSADGVAMRIADEVYGDYSLPATVKYLYESGEREIPLSSLKAILERESGETFATLPFDDWVSSAQAAGLHDLLASYLRAAAGIPVVFPRLQREESFL